MPANWLSISLLKPYKDTNYSLVCGHGGNRDKVSSWSTNIDSMVATVSTIRVRGQNATVDWLGYWYTAGYIDISYLNSGT